MSPFLLLPDQPQLAPLKWSEEEDEPDQLDPGAILSCLLDEAVTPSSPCPLDDFKQTQEFHALGSLRSLNIGY